MFKLNKTPREQSSDITKGKSEPHHIGKKSNAVLQQLFFSLINTKEGFRDEKWKKNFHELKDEILSKPDGSSLWTSFGSKYGHLGRIPA